MDFTKLLTDQILTDQIVTAKDILVDAIEKLDVGRWPRPPRRRTSTDLVNKSKLDSDDIFAAFAYADEQKLLERLPKFVAANPDLLPSNSWTDGDVVGFMNKFEAIEDKLNTVYLTQCI